jgi:hypothetical protein
MAQEQGLSSEQPQFNEQSKVIEKPAELLETSITQLEEFGGFELFEDIIDDVENINPKRKARKNIFLEESNKKEEREALKQALKVWRDALTSANDVGEIVQNCETKSASTQQNLTKNLKEAIKKTKELERSYRCVKLFFANTESNKVKNVSIVNADPERITDINGKHVEFIQKELQANYDKLDMRNNYSLLVLPGYLGNNQVVEKWAKVAYENKVLLVTDYDDLETPDYVMKSFGKANLTGGDIYRSNVIMTCNWLVGRGKYNDLGEDEDLFIPPSSALAGKIYGTLMSQPTAGKKFGGMNDVGGARFDLKKTEIAGLEKLGLVPMVQEFSKVMAFSAKTLYNGDNLGLKTYSVVRVFDYVSKVLMDFFNRRSFENFTTSSRKELLGQITNFLDSITGPGKLIEEFSIGKFEQDANQKDKVNVDIYMKPYFPAKTFMIRLAGQRGESSNEWKAQYDDDVKK